MSGDPLAHRRYKELIKKVKNAVHNDRNVWLGEDLGEGDTTKKAWAKAKLLLGNEKTPAPTAINTGNETVTDPKKLAELFAAHFDNKYKDTRAKCNMTPRVHPVQRVRDWLESIQRVPPTFTLKEASETTIIKHLKKLKPSKTLPSDDIDGYGLHLDVPLILPAITHVVNLSITTGIFPKVWKHQTVFPHHKKDQREELSNYRPVTNTVKMGLLTEYVVHEQHVDHFTTNGLFHPNHHGSMADHDTGTALIQANDFCLAAAEERKLAASLLIDQMAAFDLVDHDLLLGKLEVYGAASNALEWFRSYLKNRIYTVQVEAAKSDPVHLGPFGVPQGGVLGSTVFVIYENDLPVASGSQGDGDQQTICYVDDSNDQVAARDPQDLMDKLQIRANNLTNWLEDNRMVIAPTKTKLIVTANQHLRQARAQGVNFTVQVLGKTIHATPSERVLGMTVSQDLTWLPHFWGESWREKGNITGVIPELIKRVGLLRYLGRHTSKSKMKTLVPGIFSSKLMYALQLTSSIWGINEYVEQDLNKISCPKQTMLKLQSCQRKALALLVPETPLTYDLPTTALLEKTGMLIVHQQAAVQVAMAATKVVFTEKPSYLANKLTRDERLSRNRRLVNVPQLRLNISHEGFINQAARLINMLPPNILCEPSRTKRGGMLKGWAKEHILVKP